MAVAGKVGVRVDPLLSYNFLITLIDTSSSLVMSTINTAVFDVAVGGFTECTGVEMSLDVEEYREGGRNGESLQFPKGVRWSKITLKKGIGAGNTLWDWHYGFVTGTGKRRDGLIVLLDDLHQPTHIWHFRRGLPTRYAAPSLNAAQSAVAIESIEITHEGMYQVPGVGYAAAGVSAAVGLAV